MLYILKNLSFLFWSRTTTTLLGDEKPHFFSFCYLFFTINLHLSLIMVVLLLPIWSIRLHLPICWTLFISFWESRNFVLDFVFDVLPIWNAWASGSGNLHFARSAKRLFIVQKKNYIEKILSALRYLGNNNNSTVIQLH